MLESYLRKFLQVLLCGTEFLWLTLPGPCLGLPSAFTTEEGWRKPFHQGLSWQQQSSLLPPTPFLIIHFHGTIKHFPTRSSAEHTDRANYVEPFRFGVFCSVGFLKLLSSSGKAPTDSRGPWISPCVWLEYLWPCLCVKHVLIKFLKVNKHKWQNKNFQIIPSIRIKY